MSCANCRDKPGKFAVIGNDKVMHICMYVCENCVAVIKEAFGDVIKLEIVEMTEEEFLRVSNENTRKFFDTAFLKK
jgi:hypothetical protein